MTDPSVPPSAARILSSPRSLAAWALVGYAALHLVFTLLVWIAPGSGSVSGNAAAAYGDFTNLVVMAMPVLAVILAVHVTPPVGGARLIATIALIEYAVAILFGLLTFLIGLGAVFDSVGNAEEGVRGLEYLVMGFATFGLLAVAAYVVLRAFTGLGGRLPVRRGPVAPPAQPPPPAA